MKKNLLLVSLCFLLYACATVVYQTPNYAFGENLEFNVSHVYDVKNTTKGGGNNEVSYFANKNGVFKQVVFEIKNNSSHDKMIDFEKFKLIDRNNNEYKPEQVVQMMKLTSNTEKLRLKLNAGKTKTYAVEFWPPYPKNEEIKKLIIYGETFEIAPKK